MKRHVFFLLIMLAPIVLSQNPPVIITNIAISPDTPLPGDEIAANVTLVNKDFKETYTVTLKFVVDGSLADVKVTLLEPRSAVTAIFKWKAEGGTHIITVYLSYFTPLEFQEKRDMTLTVASPQKESPLTSPLALFTARQFIEAREGFVDARRILEGENDAGGVAEADEYLALCDKHLAAQDALAQAEIKFTSGDLEEASRLFFEARAIYGELGESESVSAIDVRLSEIEGKKTPVIPFLDRQLLLYTGIVLLVIVAVFLYTRSRERGSQKRGAPPASHISTQKTPRGDKLVFFDEGERGAPIIARCRKILEAEVPDSQAYMRIAEEFKTLSGDFSRLAPEEASGVRKSFDMCQEKVASEEKKWTSIRELEALLRRCDSFVSKYSTPDFLKKNVVDAYNLYTGMQAKFEELKGHDPELERRVTESLKKCYYLIEDEIHRMRE